MLFFVIVVYYRRFLLPKGSRKNLSRFFGNGSSLHKYAHERTPKPHTSVRGTPRLKNRRFLRPKGSRKNLLRFLGMGLNLPTL